MRREKTSKTPVILNAIIALVAFLLQYNTVFSIKLGGANPMLPLCVCVAYSMYSGELEGVIFSLIVGIVTDGAAATPICFNTVLFVLISFAISVTVRYLFNNNIRSAAVIAIFSGALYYIVRFIFCIPKQSLENAVGFSLRYTLPSIIYTAVIVIPLYLLEGVIFKKNYAR